METEIPTDFCHINSKTICLTTYYKNGRGVSTPVDIVKREDKLYFGTRELSYKLKRIRNSEFGEITPCTTRGKTTGPSMKVKVRILEDEEAISAEEIMREIYNGVLYRIFSIFEKIMRGKQGKRLYLEITC